MSRQHFSIQRTIPHAPDMLVDLVADVMAYPRFIPWIKAMRVWNQREEGDRVHFSAEAVVGYRMLTESFATHVTRDDTARTVSTSLIKGPFRSLDCRWAVLPSGPHAIVDFHIDYEFSNPVLTALLASNFGKAVGRLMDAFEAEADRRGAAGQAA